MSRKRHADGDYPEPPSKMQRSGERSEQNSVERSGEKSEQRSVERSGERREQNSVERSGERSEQNSVDYERENRFGATPLDIKRWIFSFLTKDLDVLSARRVCREWRDLLSVTIPVPCWRDLMVTVNAIEPTFPDQIHFELRGGVLSVDNTSTQRDCHIKTSLTIQDCGDKNEDFAFTVPTKKLVKFLEDVDVRIGAFRTPQERIDNTYDTCISIVVLRRIGKMLITYHDRTKSFEAVVGTTEEIDDEYRFSLPSPVTKIPIDFSILLSLRGSDDCIVTMSAVSVYVPGCPFRDWGGVLVDCLLKDQETKMLTLTVTTDENRDRANPKIKYHLIEDYKGDWIPVHSVQVDAIKRAIQKPLSACRLEYSFRAREKLGFLQRVFRKIPRDDIMLHILPDDDEGNPQPHIIQYDDGGCRISWYIIPMM
jgi:hypothetical protein